MHILFIDTCSERGVIGYGNAKNVLFAKELPFGLTQSHFLIPFLTESLKSFGFRPVIDVIGVAIGPGSYTGIRVGVAVAQTLAYSWNVPLIGICSLEGYIPSDSSILTYAAILDARIAGVYLKKEDKRHTQQFSLAQVVPLKEVSAYLEGIDHLVTPHMKPLQTKLHLQDFQRQWKWEECAPSITLLLQKTEDKWKEGKAIRPPQGLDLLYLRQTEAEREKNNQNALHVRIN